MRSRVTLESAISSDLESARDAGLWRELREIESAQEPRVFLHGREVLLFCSNNYLGLANHPAAGAAAAGALARYGASAASSRLISGHMSIHRELETALAAWKDAEAALVFGSGYLANVGVIGALVGRDDVVVSDELNHASIVDACRLSRARIAVFRHNCVEHLAEMLSGTSAARRVLVVTESLFSMDGDVAPLRAIVDIARRFGAWTYVDEAHATGVFGATGAGLVSELGLARDVDVRVGTLGKALGSSGAYVAGSRALIDLVVNRARSFIFSTALPPASAAAAIAAIELCRREPERAAGLRRRVTRLSKRLRAAGLDVPVAESQILPIRMPHGHAAMKRDAERSVEVSRRLLERGLYVAAIRPPTVPSGTSRLRVSVMANHTDEDLDQLAACLIEEMTRRAALGAG
jgi:8-amino-7-oxononanoate synthase